VVHGPEVGGRRQLCESRVEPGIAIGVGACLQQVRLAGAALAAEEEQRFAVVGSEPGGERGQGFAIAAGDIVFQAGRRRGLQVEGQLAHGSCFRLRWLRAQSPREALFG
jgi:hypothetical protein